MQKGEFILLYCIILIAGMLLCLSMVGCGATALETTLTTAEIAGEIAEKVEDLEESGAGEKVLKDVRDAVSEAHAIVDRHHKKHVRDQQ